MRTFVMGDIHGNYSALTTCLEKAKFDFKKDRLIFLGDICDRGDQTFECMELFTQLKNLVFMKGNHDLWFKDWLFDGVEDSDWLKYGGENTLMSYKGKTIPDSHYSLLESMKSYYIIDNNLFVHGGINPNIPVIEQDDSIFCWDRELAKSILLNEDPNITEFQMIYLGHTPISRMGYYLPLEKFKVTLMDTGVCWDGKLSMLNIDSQELFQS